MQTNYDNGSIQKENITYIKEYKISIRVAVNGHAY